MSDLSRLPDDPALRSFAELDRAAGLPKGAHFRAFKALGAALQEGVHFYCCDSREVPEIFARLLASGRLYPGTVNAVLLAPAGQSALREALAGGRCP